MRIIAGDWRGRPLAAVGKGDAGAHLRPTTDRVRESLFSMLAGGRFGDPITDARVLDLFAGTGALGLEALSRGAAATIFVDDGRAAQRLIRQNIATLGAGDGRSATLGAGGDPHATSKMVPVQVSPAALIRRDYPMFLGLLVQRGNPAERALSRRQLRRARSARHLRQEPPQPRWRESRGLSLLQWGGSPKTRRRAERD